VPSPYPLRTDRLVLRVMRTADAAAYRNAPEVARYQSWNLPYTEQDALGMLANQVDRDDVAPGDWTQLAVDRDGELIGDVCTHIDKTGGVAEIGFTLARTDQGQGYASEAAWALVSDLVQRMGVSRVRGEWTENMTYGATAEEWKAWTERLRDPPAELRLVPLTLENNRDYYALRTQHSEECFVAPMSWSFADALFPEVVDGAPAVLRLYDVEADGEPVAFVMIAEVTPAHPEVHLWRLLVDRRHQRSGVGRRALDLLCDQLRAEGCTTLVTHWASGPGTPAPFYRKYGFLETGEMLDEETLVRLQLGGSNLRGD